MVALVPGIQNVREKRSKENFWIYYFEKSRLKYVLKMPIYLRCS